MLLNMVKVAESHIKGDKAQLLLMDKKSGRNGSKRLNFKACIFKRRKAKNVLLRYYLFSLWHIILMKV